MPPATISALQRDSQLRHLRESMRRANVPDDAINQVVEDQTQSVYFWGYVTSITYDDLRTEVQFGGENGMVIYFPPNPTKYLPELIRAQTHVHLAVGMSLKILQESSPTILSLTISLDYPYPWPNDRPPFDVRTLTGPQNTTLTTTTSTGPSSA
jgi:hypothetical protein